MTSFSSSYNDDGTVSGGITSHEALTDQPVRITTRPRGIGEPQSLWGFVEAKIDALSCDDLETLNDFGELHDKIRDIAAHAYEMGKQEGSGVRNGNG